MSINRVTIAGNLTRDAKVRQSQSGMAVLSLGVAVNDRIKNNQTGQWEDRANFVDCTMFGQRAQSIAQYLTRGTKVCIDGKLRYSSWERDGQKHSKLEVIVDDIDFMSQRQGGQQPQRQQYQQPQYQQPQYQQPQAYQQPQGDQGYFSQQGQQMAQGVYDQDIPF